MDVYGGKKNGDFFSTKNGGLIGTDLDNWRERLASLGLGLVIDFRLSFGKGLHSYGKSPCY